MAATTDMSPNRPATAPRRAASASRRAPASRSSSREPDLEAQITQLQADLKGIASTLAGFAESKVEEAQGMAKRELKNLKTQGQNAVEDVQDEFGQIERQLKDTIREKPLTAVAGAIALGFILAVVSR
jgi:ElaB/YqjD/DUF883 family membrane-anchored ribosome-binding protein